MAIDRRDAVHRRRRIILNDDNGSIHREGSDNVESYLAYRLGHIVDSQVDSIWLSIMTRAEGLTYDTKAGEIAGRGPHPGASKAALESYGRIWGNMKSLLEAGTDPLKATIEFGHSQGREVFASFRMNMIQDSWRPNFFVRWKREHPEYCLGVRGMFEFCEEEDLHRLYWSALDYAQQPVRDQRVAVIEEICSGYDVDGMELDFWRWPALFRPTLDGLAVQRRHVEIMNDFFRRIRKRMLEIEAERKRPLLLAPRVFDTPELNLRMGLDVETWLEERLIDVLVVGGDFDYYSIPIADWAELAHKHDVPLYVCMYRSRGLEQDRALATYHRSCGADGLYTFNFKMPGNLPSIREIGEPQLIATRDKHYVMNHSVLYVGRKHVSAPGLLPVRLEEGSPQRATLLIGDDVQQAALDESLVELSLQLSLSNFTPEQDEVTFNVNGRTLGSPLRTNREGEVCRLEFTLYTRYTDVRRDPPLSQGRNTIEATLRRRGQGARGPVELVGLELWVRYQ